MDVLQVKLKTSILFILLSLSVCRSNKNEDDKKIDLPCRHVNHIKC